MLKSYLEEDRKFALNNCKMLYQDLHKPCSETCMCFGLEMGPGFFGVVKELSVKLEMLNFLFYPKYGVHIVMEQAKSKFGYLTIYHSTRIESPLIYRMWHIPFEKAYYWIRRNINYEFEVVVDKPSYESDEYEEISSDKIEEEKKNCSNISNVRFENKDGKWFKVTKLFHCQQSHLKPRKHKFIYAIEKLFWKLNCMLTFYKEPTAKQLVIRDAVDSIASQYIREAEEKCYDTCEDCGTQIGTEWSPRITTKGWISFICDTCNTKREIGYALRRIEYMVEKREITLTDDEKSIVENARERMKSDEYKSKSDYKKILESITPVADRVNAELAKKDENKGKSK